MQSNNKRTKEIIKTFDAINKNHRNHGAYQSIARVSGASIAIVTRDRCIDTGRRASQIAVERVARVTVITLAIEGTLGHSWWELPVSDASTDKNQETIKSE
jgi:hypothetical protein